MNNLIILFLTIFISLSPCGLSATQITEEHKTEIALQLKELGYDVLQISNGGDNALHLAVKKKNLEAVKLLLDYGIPISRTNKAGDTPLHIAASKSELTIVEYLVEQGAEINLKNDLGQTPYHKALARSDTLMTAFFENAGYQPGDSFEDYLIAMGTNPDHVDNAGNTLLHRLVKTGNLELLRETLKHGYNVNVYNKAGDSPLDLALKKGDMDMVEVLEDYFVQLEADPEYVDKSGNTILHRLVKTGNLELLIELLNQGYDPKASNHSGETPLDLAVKKRDLEMTSFLIDYQQGKNLSSELEAAFKAGWAEGVELLYSKTAPQYIALTINQRNGKGIAPIHYACASGSLETVQFLIEKGANINSQTTSEYYHSPSSTYYWSSAAWDAWGDFGNMNHIYDANARDGYIQPVVTPLAIVKSMHADNQELIQYLEGLGAKSVYHRSIKYNTLEDYLR